MTPERLVVMWGDKALRWRLEANNADARGYSVNALAYTEAARVYEECAKDLRDALAPSSEPLTEEVRELKRRLAVAGDRRDWDECTALESKLDDVCPEWWGRDD